MTTFFIFSRKTDAEAASLASATVDPNASFLLTLSTGIYLALPVYFFVISLRWRMSRAVVLSSSQNCPLTCQMIRRIHRNNAAMLRNLCLISRFVLPHSTLVRLRGFVVPIPDCFCSASAITNSVFNLQWCWRKVTSQKRPIKLTDVLCKENGGKVRKEKTAEQRTAAASGRRELINIEKGRLKQWETSSRLPRSHFGLSIGCMHFISRIVKGRKQKGI